MKQFTHGSLFAGIGGFDLGFERAGFKTIWQVEIDPFCRKVLEKHWPNVKRFADVRECSNLNLSTPDIISGGFPCQDVSYAGNRQGLDGERSWLWCEMRRLLCELRPRYAVVENVPGLLSLGMGRVLGDLAESGYDAEWDCLPAYSFGAPHARDRVFIIANLQNADDAKHEGQRLRNRILSQQPRRIPWWPSYAGIRRGNDGIPAAMDRLHSLGNAIVPVIAEWIAKRIKAVLESEAA